MTDNKVFTIQRNLRVGKMSIIESVGSKEKYLIAMTRNPKSCPINFLSIDWGGRMLPQSIVLNRCEDEIADRAAKQNKSPAVCCCIILKNSNV